MIGFARSKNNARVRLTEERWRHITGSHDDLAGYASEVLKCIEEPDYLVKGIAEESIACKKYGDKYLVSIYKEDNRDGFVITAYFTKKIGKLLKRGILWRRQ